MLLPEQQGLSAHPILVPILAFLHLNPSYQVHPRFPLLLAYLQALLAWENLGKQPRLERIRLGANRGLRARNLEGEFLSQDLSQFRDRILRVAYLVTIPGYQLA